MKDIVDNTGFSKGAFYHYFTSKEQVFNEVISLYFADMIMADHSRFSQRSLKEFYNDVLQHHEQNRQKFIQMTAAEDEPAFNSNYYYLVFDALKMLPDFKEQYRQSQRAGIRAWENVIGIARRNKEIRSGPGDKLLAKLFVNAGDGAGVNLVMSNNPNKKKNELRDLWDGLYELLKR